MYLYQVSFWKNADESAGIVSVIFDDNKNIIDTQVATTQDFADEFVQRYGGYKWDDYIGYPHPIVELPKYYPLTPGVPIAHRGENE